MTISINAGLTDGPIAERLFYMALPMVGGLLATMSFNIVDTFFVSGLGKHALAALSFTFPVVMLVISIAIGLGAGTSTVVALAAGRNDRQAVCELVTDSMSLTALVTLVLTLIGLLTITPLFTAMGATEDILPLIRDYMIPWYFSVIFLAVPMVGMAAIRALGDTKLQANVMIGMAVANAVLDPILIYGWWIFPRMEIQGAAVASLVIRIVSLGVMLYYVGYRMKLLSYPVNVKSMLNSWGKILHVGIPATATNMIIPASGAVVIALIASHGADAVAGFGVASRIEGFALILFYSLSAVIGPFCGQNLGAGKTKRLYDSQRVCAIFCLISGAVIALTLAVLGPFLGSIFSDRIEVVDVASSYLLWVPLSYFAYGVVMVVNASFNGLGKPLPGVLLSSTRVIFLLLPLAWFGNMFFGLIGVFAAIAISNVIVGIWGYLWVRRTIGLVSG